MNTKILLLSSALLLPVTAFALPAEDGYDTPADHRLERLDKELQLSDEQEAKLAVIFKEQHEKFRAIHEQSHGRIKEVLTPEQMSQWEAMKKQRQEQRRNMLQQHRQSRPQ